MFTPNWLKSVLLESDIMTAKKPTRLKIIQGTAKPGRAKEPQPQPAAHLPTPPGISKESQKLWKELAPELQRLGLLSTVDVPALIMTVVAGGVAMEAAKALRQQGLTRLDENKVERKNPHFQLFRDAAANYYRWASRFGLTPADRAGLNVPGSEEINSLEKFLADAVGGRK